MAANEDFFINFDSNAVKWAASLAGQLSPAHDAISALGEALINLEVTSNAKKNQVIENLGVMNQALDSVQRKMAGLNPQQVAGGQTAPGGQPIIVKVDNPKVDSHGSLDKILSTLHSAADQSEAMLDGLKASVRVLTDFASTVGGIKQKVEKPDRRETRQERDETRNAVAGRQGFQSAEQMKAMAKQAVSILDAVAPDDDGGGSIDPSKPVQAVISGVTQAQIDDASFDRIVRAIDAQTTVSKGIESAVKKVESAVNRTTTRLANQSGVVGQQGRRGGPAGGTLAGSRREVEGGTGATPANMEAVGQVVANAVSGAIAAAGSAGAGIDATAINAAVGNAVAAAMHAAGADPGTAAGLAASAEDKDWGAQAAAIAAKYKTPTTGPDLPELGDPKKSARKASIKAEVAEIDGQITHLGQLADALVQQLVDSGVSMQNLRDDNPLFQQLRQAKADQSQLLERRSSLAEDYDLSKAQRRKRNRELARQEAAREAAGEILDPVERTRRQDIRRRLEMPGADDFMERATRRGQGGIPKQELVAIARTFNDQVQTTRVTGTKEQLAQAIKEGFATLRAAGGIAAAREDLTLGPKVTPDAIPPRLVKMLGDVLPAATRSAQDVENSELLRLNSQGGGEFAWNVIRGKAQRGSAFGGPLDDTVTQAEDDLKAFYKNLKRVSGVAGMDLVQDPTFDPYDRELRKQVEGSGEGSKGALLGLSYLQRSTEAIDAAGGAAIEAHDRMVVAQNTYNRMMEGLNDFKGRELSDAEQAEYDRQQLRTSRQRERADNTQVAFNDIARNLEPIGGAHQFLTPQYREGYARREGDVRLRTYLPGLGLGGEDRGSRGAYEGEGRLLRQRYQDEQDMRRAFQGAQGETYFGARPLEGSKNFFKKELPGLSYNSGRETITFDSEQAALGRDPGELTKIRSARNKLNRAQYAAMDMRNRGVFDEEIQNFRDATPEEISAADKKVEQRVGRFLNAYERLFGWSPTFEQYMGRKAEDPDEAAKDLVRGERQASKIAPPAEPTKKLTKSEAAQRNLEQATGALTLAEERLAKAKQAAAKLEEKMAKIRVAAAEELVEAEKARAASLTPEEHAQLEAARAAHAGTTQELEQLKQAQRKVPNSELKASAETVRLHSAREDAGQARLAARAALLHKTLTPAEERARQERARNAPTRQAFLVDEANRARAEAVQNLTPDVLKRLTGADAGFTAADAAFRSNVAAGGKLPHEDPTRGLGRTRDINAQIEEVTHRHEQAYEQLVQLESKMHVDEGEASQALAEIAQELKHVRSEAADAERSIAALTRAIPGLQSTADRTVAARNDPAATARRKLDTAVANRAQAKADLENAEKKLARALSGETSAAGEAADASGEAADSSDELAAINAKLVQLRKAEAETSEELTAAQNAVAEAQAAMAANMARIQAGDESVNEEGLGAPDLFEKAFEKLERAEAGVSKYGEGDAAEQARANQEAIAALELRKSELTSGATTPEASLDSNLGQMVPTLASRYGPKQGGQVFGPEGIRARSESDWIAELGGRQGKGQHAQIDALMRSIGSHLRSANSSTAEMAKELVAYQRGVAALPEPTRDQTLENWQALGRRINVKGTGEDQWDELRDRISKAPHVPTTMYRGLQSAPSGDEFDMGLSSWSRDVGRAGDFGKHILRLVGGAQAVELPDGRGDEMLLDEGKYRQVRSYPHPEDPTKTIHEVEQVRKAEAESAQEVTQSNAGVDAANQELIEALQQEIASIQKRVARTDKAVAEAEAAVENVGKETADAGKKAAKAATEAVEATAQVATATAAATTEGVTATPSGNVKIEAPEGMVRLADGRLISEEDRNARIAERTALKPAQQKAQKQWKAQQEREKKLLEEQTRARDAVRDLESRGVVSGPKHATAVAERTAIQAKVEAANKKKKELQAVRDDLNAQMRDLDKDIKKPSQASARAAGGAAAGGGAGSGGGAASVGAGGAAGGFDPACCDRIVTAINAVNATLKSGIRVTGAGGTTKAAAAGRKTAAETRQEKLDRLTEERGALRAPSDTTVTKKEDAAAAARRREAAAKGERTKAQKEADAAAAGADFPRLVKAQKNVEARHAETVAAEAAEEAAKELVAKARRLEAEIAQLQAAGPRRSRQTASKAEVEAAQSGDRDAMLAAVEAQDQRQKRLTPDDLIAARNEAHSEVETRAKRETEAQKKAAAASRQRARDIQELKNALSLLSKETLDQVAALRQLNQVSADVAKTEAHQTAIAEQQGKVYAGIQGDLSRQGVRADDTRRLARGVLSDAGPTVGAAEVDAIARNARTVDTGLAQQIAPGGGSAFEDAIGSMFGTHGFWARVMGSTGTFIVRNFAAGFVFGITNALQEMVQQALITEATFVRVSGALEATGKPLGNLRTDLQSISLEYGVALNDVYESAAGLTGLFQTPEEIAGATKVVAQLESISMGALNAQEGMKSLASITGAFGAELGAGADGFAHVADALTVIQQNLGTNIEVTAEGVARMSGLASQMKLTFEDTATYVGAVSKMTGQTGEGAGEQLSRIMAVIQSSRGREALVDTLKVVTPRDEKGRPTGKGVETGVEAQLDAGEYGQVFKTLLKSWDDLTIAQQNNLATTLAGQKNAASFQALMKNSTSVLNTATKATYGHGEADKRAAEIARTLNAQVSRLGKGFQALAGNLMRTGILDVFAGMLWGFNKLLQGVNWGFSKINQLFESNEALNWIKSLLVGLVGLSIGFSLVARSIMGMKAAMGAVAADSKGLLGMGAPGTAGKHRAGGAPAAAASPTPNLRTGLASSSDWFATKRDEARQRAYQAQGLTSPSTQRGLNLAAGGLGVETTGAGQTEKASKAARASNIALAKTANVAAGATGRLSSGLTAFVGASIGAQAAMIGIGIAISGLVSVFLAQRERAKATEQAFQTSFGKPKREDGEENQELTAIGPATEQFYKNRLRFGDVKDPYDPKSVKEGAGGLASFARTIGAEAANFFDHSPFSAQFYESGRNRSEGILKDEDREELGEFRGQQFKRIRGSSTLKELRENIKAGNKETDKIAREINADDTKSDAQKATALHKLEKLVKDVGEEAALLSLKIQGIGKADYFTNEAIGRLTDVRSTALNAVGRSDSDLREGLRDQIGRLGVSDKSTVRPLLAKLAAGRQGKVESIKLTDEILRKSLDAAKARLVSAEKSGDDQKIEAAEQQVNALVNELAASVDGIIDAIIGTAIAIADHAIHVGDFSGSQDALQSAIDQINAMRPTDRGRRVSGSFRDPELERGFVGLDENQKAEDLRLWAQGEPLRQRKRQQAIERRNAQRNMANADSENPYANAVRDKRSAGEALRILKQSRDEFGDEGASLKEIREAKMAWFQANNQVMQISSSVAMAQASAAAAGMWNEVAIAQQNEVVAALALAEAMRTGDPAAIAAAQGQVAGAAKSTAQAHDAEAQAARETAAARVPPGNAVAVARMQLANARAAQADALKYGASSTQYQSATQQVIAAQWQMMAATDELVQSQTAVAIALADAAGHTVKSASLQVRAANQALAAARKQSGGNSAAVNQARAQVITARAAARDARLQDQLDTIDFNLQMGKITQSSAITALQEILRTQNLTKAQRRQLLLQIKGMKDELSGSPWNFGDIKLPTPYQMRRYVEQHRKGLAKQSKVIADAQLEAGGGASRAARQGIEGGGGGSTSTSTVTNQYTFEIDGADTGMVRKIIEDVVGRPGRVRTTASRRR